MNYLEKVGLEEDFCALTSVLLGCSRCGQSQREKTAPGAKGGLRLEGLVQNSLWDLVLEDLSSLGAARPKKLKFNLSL